ncbi:MAG: PIN domain-containing protein [Methyloceanibacter sp.]
MTNGAPIYLDANVFIDFIEGDEAISTPIDPLMQALKRRPGSAITSKLTLAEVLAPSKGRKRHPPIRRLYLNLLVWGPFIHLHPISRSVLYETANLRATNVTAKLKLLDAIHLATALLSGCRLFVSRDRNIPMPTEMRRVEADASSVAEIVEALG